MTKGITAVNVCTLNSAISYWRLKYGQYQLRVYASDNNLKDESVTSINKKAETLNAPYEEFVLVSNM